MFTGIIETVGTVIAIEGGPDGKRFTIESDLVTSDLDVGDSVAVNGVCLTATTIAGSRFSVDTIVETLSDWANQSKDVAVLTEYVRNALRRAVSQ